MRFSQTTDRLQPFHWREAALCLPAMPLLVLSFGALGQPAFGAVAAGASFAVGFGAAREIGGYRWSAMFLAMVGMALAAMAGTLIGNSPAAFVASSAILAGVCAALALRNEHLWWVFLQVVIAYLVAGYYAGDAGAAIDRGAMTLLGGGVQITIVVILASIFPRAAEATIAPRALPQVTRALFIGHIVRAALCVGGSLLLIKPLGLANGYWAPMTALIVLKPRLSETRTRGLERLGGTLSGCAIATVFAYACRENTLALVGGMAISAGAAFALQKAHYGSLTGAITATIVLLASLGQVSALGSAEHRVIATLVGGCLALLVAFVLPHRMPIRRLRTDIIG